jgi:hypothetical protein
MLTIDANDERLLLNAIREGDVVLALGAGASATSTKPDGERVRQGGSLAELLATKAGVTYNNDDLPDVIAGVVGPRISETQFHDILHDEYTKINPSPELSDLLRYTWRRLYTWNVDDSVNHIKDSVQRRRYFNGLIDKVAVHEGHDYLQVISLHGEASKPEHGFIFSPAEYNRRLNQDNHDWYRSLAADYISHTPMFIGSRLKEPILSAELDRARPQNGQGHGLAFLVTPDKFTDIQLAGFKARNVVVITATLDVFITWLHLKMENSLTPTDVARKTNAFAERLISATTVTSSDIESAEYIVLRDWKTAKADADSLDQPSFRRIARTFLEGSPPTWQIAATTIPVWLQPTESLYKAMVNAIVDRERCFLAYGQAGSGKTMAIMQCLLRFVRENPNTYLYEVKRDVRSLRTTLSLISRLHKDDHVILYVQDAFIFGDSLGEDLMGIERGRITLVTTARSGEWRDHIERRIGAICKTFIFQRFGEGDYKELIKRLIDFVPAPAFLKLSSAKQIAKIRESKSQLLIALRETTDSEKFTTVITNEFLSLPDDDSRYLAILVGLATLARSGIRKSEAKTAYEHLSTKKSFEAALLSLEGIISTEIDGRLWARHELYIRHLIENVADFDIVVNGIVEILRTYTRFKVPIVKTVGRLDSILFKFLLNHNFTAELAKRRHRTEEGRRIYEAYEVEFQLDGHFWLQYGQYLVTIGEDEEALSVLSKSIKAYSDNPYAVHAFADLQLKVAAKRPTYDSATAKLIGDAVKTLEQQHSYSSWDSDQYPMVTLAEKHVWAMLKHGKSGEARILAHGYFKELENMARNNSAKPLQRARERLAHFVTSGTWHEGNLPSFSGNSKPSSARGRRPRSTR